ncbi:MAG: PAS domain-containing protein [Nitrosopumilus sp.]|uniref:Sporulation kinase C n=2 Tax=Nitrosopumilus TaxID=338191 RepID=A0A2S2KSS6_9ARCH|nr:ATP-binding protein [Nitrosopumilus zosterae]MCV0366726.1 PAS domain-containing protein [Nitrosopumilus sp.]BDQ30665.1 ATP-binding protein [Nitrosopumilus zosterae]GBH34722.1 sporulation kinase C [Nitrosopumilus zosterae]
MAEKMKISKMEKQNSLEDNLRRAIDSSSIVTVMNTNGIVTHVNQKFCEISGFAENEIIGTNLLMLRSGVHPIEYYDELWATISKGEIWTGEICNQRKNGELFWNKATIIPIKNQDGEIIEYIAIRFDITNQKEKENKMEETLMKLQKSNQIIEEQSKKLVKQEKLVTIGELAARLSHDIRNPLSIIRVSLENLKIIYGKNELETKHFDRVERAIDRISHQIDDVLGFIRKEPMRFEKTLISEIIADSLDSINLPDRIYFEISKNDFEIYCDKKRLSVAITNLILNAIQGIEGKGTIEIILEDKGENIVIKIKDSGKGIPSDIIEEIFEPLFTTKQQGTGLGLASVKSIINGHGGKIFVTSPPTVFTIIIPKKGIDNNLDDPHF